jgi:hypothetical protein
MASAQRSSPGLKSVSLTIYSTTRGPADGVQLLEIEAEVAAWRTLRRA